ncbi:MAG: hypothetical protein QOI39_1712, partial [Mycobacterium sp.]|nr:hypothetical protein [Mycobacterium sp.]
DPVTQNEQLWTPQALCETCATLASLRASMASTLFAAPFPSRACLRHHSRERCLPGRLVPQRLLVGTFQPKWRDSSNALLRRSA